ncbi:hypothetical protein D3C78_481310 [compost metagenome]
MLVQLVRRDAPGVFQLGELVLERRFAFGLVAGLAQDAHDPLAELVEHVVGVAAVRLAAGGVEAGGIGQLVDQLLEGDTGVLDQRLHGVHRLEAGVEVDRVIDAEHGLADLVAAAGGAALHLLVEDARTHPAHEHQMADARHVDAGGEQVDGDGDARVTLVLVLAD